MTTVHQLVPSMVPHDATSDHTLQVQRVLRAAGYESEIFALAVHDDLQDRVHLVHELRGPSRPTGHLIYQMSAVSELGDLLLERREQLALNYHNVTPAHFFHRWDRSTAMALGAGRRQLTQLARRRPLGICDSAFNADDLRHHGVTETTVAPVLVDPATFDVEPDRATAERLARRAERGGATWLFVGAVAPHKAQHELVQALAAYRRVYDGRARLLLVGRQVCPPYAEAVRRHAADLGLAEAVILAGPATQEQLAAYFHHADVFVTMSRHEGFCVPVLEAMAYDLPVVARPAGAVADTVGYAGLLVTSGDAPAVAAAVARVLDDGTLRRRLVVAGRERREQFDLSRTSTVMAAALRGWLEGGAAAMAGAAAAAGGAAAGAAAGGAAAGGAAAVSGFLPLGPTGPEPGR